MFFGDDKAEISESIEMVILLFRNKNRIRVKKQIRDFFLGVNTINKSSRKK
jgi:hypothetical protein